MKKVTAAAERELSIAELKKKADALGRELLEDRLMLREGKLKDTAVVKMTRHHLAVLRTVLREKEYLAAIKKTGSHE